MKRPWQRVLAIRADTRKEGSAALSPLLLENFVARADGAALPQHASSNLHGSN